MMRTNGHRCFEFSPSRARADRIRLDPPLVALPEWSLSGVTHLPLIDGKTVFVPFQDGTLGAYTISDASVRWKYATGVDFASGTGTGSVLLDDDEILLALSNEIRRLDLQGQQIGTLRVDEADLAGAFTFENALISGCWDEGMAVAAFDVETGRKRWSHPLSSYNAAFTLESGVVCFRHADDVLMGLDASTGAERFRFSLELLRKHADIPASTRLQSRGRAVGWHGTILAAVMPNLLIAVDVLSGGLRWASKLATENAFGFAVYDDQAFVLGWQALETIDLRTGEARALDVENELAGHNAVPAFTQLAPTDQHLFCGDSQGLLLAINRQTAVIDWTESMPQPLRAPDIPVAVGNRLYVRDSGDNLRVFASKSVR